MRRGRASVSVIGTVSAPDFGEFFEAEQGPLVRFCWGLTGDREEARDVAQEAMARAWSDWERFAGPGSNPAAWTRTVALNLVRGNWRRQKVAEADRPRQVAEAREWVVLDGNGPDLDLVRALGELAARQREAVVLHHLMDLPVDECAEVMGVAPSTVKVHLVRGRAALAECLGVGDEAGGHPANDPKEENR